MDNAKKRGGRPRSGQLIWRKSGWIARLTVVVDGERVRVSRALGTDNKAVARRKLARLLESDDTSPEEAARSETFEEAARRIVAGQAAEGHRTWKDRLARLQRLAFPEFGQLPVNEVRPPHIRQALDLGLSKGLSRRTLALVKIDVSTVLGELWRDEVIAVNPAAQVLVPKGAPCDDRERVVLTDEEFGAFMACPDIAAELHMMALASRTLGGMRTSDLHAWDWAHIDTVHWSGARVPRPKTKTKDRLALPPVLVPVFASLVGRTRQAHGRPCFPSSKRSACWGAETRQEQPRPSAPRGRMGGRCRSTAPGLRSRLDGSGSGPEDERLGGDRGRRARGQAPLSDSIRLGRIQAARLSLVPPRLQHGASRRERQRSDRDAPRWSSQRVHPYALRPLHGRAIGARSVAARSGKGTGRA